MLLANIHKAKTNLARLVDAALSGEDIVITKRGKAAVRLVPVEPIRPVRQPGVLRGRIKIADDFDAPLPEELQNAFEGK
jgi:prevent-host-death family protein